MLGVTAEQFARRRTALSLMGGAGMLSVAVVLPVMGARIDSLGAGAALQLVAGIGLVLAVIFGALSIYFGARGGYKPVTLAAAAPGPHRSSL